jgi:CheY-like chemotaxis protein
MKLRAFVFDDDDVVRMLCCAALQKRGYEVYDYPEAAECPACRLGCCPCPEDHTCGDIIIADINMAPITVIELLERFVAYGCRVRHFALMSGWWSDFELKKAKELGCKVLKKPYTLDDLYRWLDRCEASINRKRKLWGDWFRVQE